MDSSLKMPDMLPNQSVSVVIATLGGDMLAATLLSLNEGSFVPEEILICIPEENAHFVLPLECFNVKVLKTNFRGQVAQRAFGFARANCDLVMQLDDDILLDHHCIERLVNAMVILGSNAAVSPALIAQHSGQSVYAKPSVPKFIESFYFWLMNGVSGYQPGKIDLAGSAIGVDPVLAEERLVEVEWLAGGCVLHRQKNLVKENFWTRQGKAYCEDVVHSHILIQRGIRLFVDTSARCELEVTSQSTLGFSAFFIELYRDFCARKYYMHRLSRSSVRIYLHYLVRIASYAFARLRHTR